MRTPCGSTTRRPTRPLLGFVNPGVKSDGVLRTLGRLPANANHFKQLLVTRETQAKPHSPGTIVLQGALSLPAA